MKIILMGPQGSGKGTQAKLISREYGIPHISTGDLLRAEIGEGTDMGKALQDIIAAGRLVPDETILYMAGKRLARPDCADGFIADGFPRNLRQLLELKEVWSVDLALQIWIDTRTSVERLATRINCPNCKATYGPKKPPKQEGICDECGAKLVQRTDDTATESVIKRLELYWSEIQPVLEYFRSGSRLHTINGDRPVEDVYAAIRASIEPVYQSSRQEIC